jgi:hypothetical protein
MKVEITTEMISMSISILTFFVYVIGAIIAYKAVTVYKNQAGELNKQTAIQIDLSLRSAWNEISQLIVQYPYLVAFFADFPEDEEPSLKLAHQQINLFLETGTFEGWTTSEDLMIRLYEPTHDYHSVSKTKLRGAYHISEQLLYLLHDAYGAYKSKIITAENYETWIAFIDGIGFHPIFLSAVQFGHSGGYITKDFAKHLKERLLRSDTNRKAIEILYSDMLRDDWLERLGKQQYGKTKKNN